jgi:DNA helicase-2/ATP-dependent DNA helicase PcrA
MTRPGYVSADFHEQLTESQRRAVCHFQGPLLVLAGPGSGKTRVITNRIAALISSGVAASSICAVTFTNKAAGEMKQRVSRLLQPNLTGSAPHISTFHSMCVRILRKYSRQAAIQANFTIYDEQDQHKCITEAVKSCEIDPAAFPPAKMLDAISLLKNRLCDVETFESQADNFFTATLARIYRCYQQLLAERSALDFDDLLLKTAFLLRDCPDVQRQLSSRFKFLLIDEYQDTNHAQYQIAKYLVAGHANICATGDPDQSIYGWRGADINNILLFEEDFPDAVIVRLEENFRSTPNILKRADTLIAFNKSRKPKTLIPTRPEGPDVVIADYEDDAEEAQTVTDKIRQLIAAGAAPSSIAVFYRVNAMSRPLEEAFIKGQIPYQIVRGVEFYNRKEIRDVLAYLKVLANPQDEIALLRIINTPARGLGKTSVSRVSAYAKANNLSLYEAIKQSDEIEALPSAARTRMGQFIKMLEDFRCDIEGEVAPLVRRVCNESGLAEALRAEPASDAAENVAELINAAAVYDQHTENPSLPDYLQQIALFTDSDSYDSQKGAVALMTLHCAKGLEFESVFMVGVEQGILPHIRSSDSQAELEEERRLLFVGITRAKTGLQISYAKYRQIRGQLTRTSPSDFLFELEPGFLDRQDDYGTDEQSERDSGANNRQDENGVIFSPGERVKHELFGIGTVTKYVDMGPHSIVVVRFSSGSTKSLMLKYANLARIVNG